MNYSPHTIEIEISNLCNANCVFCKNKDLGREKGFMSLDLFKKSLEQLGKLKLNNIFNIKSNTNDFPKIVFAGLGEPLLNPSVFEMIRMTKENGFYVSLVTNGIVLNQENAIKLIDCGVNEIAISLHSLNSQIYHTITGVDLSLFLPSMEMALNILDDSAVKVSIWRIYHPSKNIRDSVEDNKKFDNFIRKHKINEVLGPSEPWERDGVVKDCVYKKTEDKYCWCHKIPFTFNIDYMGDNILCCVDYNRKTVNLGNVLTDDINVLYNNKIKFLSLRQNERPSICKNCKRWKDTEIDLIKQNYNMGDLNL